MCLPFTEACTICDNGGGGSKRQEVKVLLRRLMRDNPNIENSIFRSIHAVSLDTMPGYKSEGVEHSFLERFDRVEEELKTKKGFPEGGGCPRSGLMRAELLRQPFYRAAAAACPSSGFAALVHLPPTGGRLFYYPSPLPPVFPPASCPLLLNKREK